MLEDPDAEIDIMAAEPQQQRRHHPLSASRSNALSARKWVRLTPWDWIGAVVAVAVTTVLFFWPLTQGQTFHDVSNRQTTLYPWMGLSEAPSQALHFDQTDSFYPWRVFVGRALHAGELPLWNPYSFAGQPFLANGQNGVLYPPRFALTLLVSPEHVYDYLAASHMFVGGLSMLLLLRSARLSAPASVFGALAWMLNSFMLAWMVTEHYLAIEAWLPLAFYALRCTISRSSWTWSLVAGVVLALMFLGGNLLFVEAALLAWGAYATFLVLDSLRLEWRSAPSAELVGLLLWRSSRASLSVLVMCGLIAFPALPTMQLVASMQRGLPTYDEILAARMSVEHLVNLFGPFIPLADVYHSALFVGSTTAVLALVGLISKADVARYARWLAPMVLLFSLGTVVTWVAYSLLPGIGYLKPSSRSLFLFDFGIAILGACGLDILATRTGAPGYAWFRRRVARGIALASAIAIMAYAVTVGFQNLTPNQQVTLEASMGLVALLATAPRWLRAEAWVGWCLVAILFVQMQQFADTFVRRQPDLPNLLYPQTPLIQQVEADGHRILPVLPDPSIGGPLSGRMFFASTPMVFPLGNASGYDSLVPDRIARFWRVVEGVAPEQAVAEHRVNAYGPDFFATSTRFDLLSRASVTDVVTPPYIEDDPTWRSRAGLAGLRLTYSGPDGHVYSVPTPLPRLYFATRCELALSPLDALERFTDAGLSPSTTVVLEADHLPRGSPACPTATNPADAATPDEAQIVGRSLNSLTIQLDAPNGGWLVVDESWDDGWHATVDGSAVAVVPANYAFRAISVVPGAKNVSFSYWPSAYTVGGIVSASTLLALLMCAAVGSLQRGRRGPCNR